TWNVAMTVEPLANVSGSTSVACWLVGFVYGAGVTRLSATVAPALPGRSTNAPTAAVATAFLGTSFIGFSPSFDRGGLARDQANVKLRGRRARAGPRPVFAGDVPGSAAGR